MNPGSFISGEDRCLVTRRVPDVKTPNKTSTTNLQMPSTNIVYNRTPANKLVGSFLWTASLQTMAFTKRRCKASFVFHDESDLNSAQTRDNARSRAIFGIF